MWRKPSEAKPSPLTSKDAAADGPASAKLPQSPVVPGPPIPPSSSMPSSDSTVRSGLRIHGEISGTSDLYIDGEMVGKVSLEGARVSVGSNGSVQADIEGREIVVAGSVKGNLRATERIRLSATGRVHGSLLAPGIAIEEGASVSGSVETGSVSESRRRSARPRSESRTLQPVGAEAEND